MSPRFESFLARIYTDAEARARFLADPEAETVRAGLDADERAALGSIDRDGLELTARGLSHKRKHRHPGAR